MGKRLSRNDLLAEIQIERVRLDLLLEDLGPRQMTRGDVTRHGWSVKDILGHVVGWQQLNLDWIEFSKRGETVELPAPGFSWKDVHRLNEKIYRNFHRQSLKNVVGQYQQLHQEMIKLIGSVTDRELVTLGFRDWTGPSWTLSDYIRANTASHYRWAAKHVRKWRKRESINR